MNVRERCLWSIGLLGVAVIWGCGAGEARPRAVVQGTVTLNGKPLEQGSVRFTSAKTGETAYVNLGPGGKYSVEIPEVDLGEAYQVAIGKTIEEETDAMALAVNPPPAMTVKIPPKYAERSTSGISLVIEAGGAVPFDIELE